MIKKFLLFIYLIISSTFVFGQEITQTVRGKVVDKESKFPLFGVVVKIEVGENSLGATTDFDGKFKLEGVPVGRHTAQIKYVGYNQQALPLIINSGKELILNIEMEEAAFEMKEVEVKATQENGVRNEMAMTSVKGFSVEETDRYAGSRSDPARMASNFAGVQGTNDSRNDIVIRGNSPLGVLWRVEGVDIPNPNHFSIPGSSGGPTSIMNNKMMGNSDFFTGAFPAEYGNSNAGVFDIRLRSGNNEKTEVSAQFGILGTELMIEGPISKEKGSSFLATYRYSTIALFSKIGISIGTDAAPIYQDAAFKLNFPTKKGSLAFWGMGGKSGIDILISDQEVPNVDLYGQNDRDQYFNTLMGVTGLTYTQSINEKTFFKTTISASYEKQHANHDYINRYIDSSTGKYVVTSLDKMLDYTYGQTKLSWAAFVNKKLSKRTTLKYGFNTDLFIYNYQDSVRNLISNVWSTRWDFQGSSVLLQPYVQLKHQFSERFGINFGLHSQYFSLNNSFSAIEPRAGFKYSINEKQTLSGGIGLHSQTLPPYTYFYILPGNTGLHNKNVGFSRSFHSVIGYDYKISPSTKIKAEAYYQSLYDIPVEKRISSFSVANLGSGYFRLFPDTLVNKGTGTNYGLELTLEKMFGKGYYFMITGSVYNSTYKGSDGIERNTSFNGNFATNFLFGKEFKVGERSSFAIGGKVTIAGGQRYGVVDTIASGLQGEIVYLDSGFNANQFANYFRADLKLNYKINAKKVTHEIGLDLVNFLGIKNILSLTYAPVPGDPTADPIQKNYQLGFLPLFYYRIDF